MRNLKADLTCHIFGRATLLIRGSDSLNQRDKFSSNKCNSAGFYSSTRLLCQPSRSQPSFSALPRDTLSKANLLKKVLTSMPQCDRATSSCAISEGRNTVFQGHNLPAQLEQKTNNIEHN